MTDDPRVEELLEELLDSGGTPEEVCRSCPELLDQVRAGWQRLRAVEAEVARGFQSPPPQTMPNRTGSWHACERLPTSRAFPATKYRSCWATAAWESSIRPGTCG